MKKVIILFAAIGIMAISWLAFAKEFKFHSENKKAVLDEAMLKLDNGEEMNADFSDDEKTILRELQDLFKAFSSKTPFFLSGSIDLYNPADSSEMTASSPFDFLKNEDIIYYKNDGQESINTEKYYAIADHAAKKIMVTASKSIQEISPVPFSALSKNFKNDGYTIERTEQGNKAIIKLLSENHISCKEIKIEFDPVTRKPSLLFYRFTDFDYPDDKKHDKTITIHIKNWEVGSAAAKSYTVPQLISITNESIIGSKGFEEYEIMNLLNN
jgi:hypothetical protein